jgi:hypothetical protein
MVDAGLTLKMNVENGEEMSEEAILQLLSTSELVQSLTQDFSKSSLFPIWRIFALAEIPFAERLNYTQNLLDYIQKTYATSEGFSITGKSEDLLPCYNAMLIEAFSKLGQADLPLVKTAVDWVLNYQVFGRNEQTSWQGKGIKKYGGCMKSTPCFIGIAKTVKALIYYSSVSTTKDVRVLEAINKGTEYLLQHNLFQRLSNKEPINNHILDIAYPQSYQLNIIELLDIAFMTKNMNNPRVKEAVDYIKNNKSKDDSWKINYIYKADGFVSFDKRGKRGEWVSYLLAKYLSQTV